MNIYQNSTYRKELRWLYCDNEPKTQERHQLKDPMSDILVSVACLTQGSFELTYCDSVNTIHFSFFMLQFFRPSLKIMIPKHNAKMKISFYFNFSEKLFFTEFSTRICWNRSLAASGLFFLFVQSSKFYKFHWHMLRKRLFIK